MRVSWFSAAAAAVLVAATAGVRLEARDLTLEFQFLRLRRIASNQLAVWIEDSNGHHVRTLVVTDFTARRQGHRRRPAALPRWVRAFDPASRPRSEVDAVSRPTPPAGKVTLSWDGADETGSQVAAGTYLLHIEGNIFWETTVYYRIPVEIGSTPFTVEASPESLDASTDLPLLRDVRVSYRP